MTLEYCKSTPQTTHWFFRVILLLFNSSKVLHEDSGFFIQTRTKRKISHSLISDFNLSTKSETHLGVFFDRHKDFHCNSDGFFSVDVNISVLSRQLGALRLCLLNFCKINGDRWLHTGILNVKHPVVHLIYYTLERM